MLDVIHYFFETDINESVVDDVSKARDRNRIQIYEVLYESEYPYASPSNRNESFNPNLPPIDAPVNESLEPPGFQGGQPSVKKRYIPPTQIREGLANPYQGVLDAPLN